MNVDTGVLIEVVVLDVEVVGDEVEVVIVFAVVAVVVVEEDV